MLKFVCYLLYRNKMFLNSKLLYGVRSKLKQQNKSNRLTQLNIISEEEQDISDFRIQSYSFCLLAEKDSCETCLFNVLILLKCKKTPEMETLIFVVQFDLKFNFASSFLFCNRLTKRKLNLEIMAMARRQGQLKLYQYDQIINMYVTIRRKADSLLACCTLHHK